MAFSRTLELPEASITIFVLTHLSPFQLNVRTDIETHGIILLDLRPLRGCDHLV